MEFRQQEQRKDQHSDTREDQEEEEEEEEDQLEQEQEEEEVEEQEEELDNQVITRNNNNLNTIKPPHHHQLPLSFCGPSSSSSASTKKWPQITTKTDHHQDAVLMDYLSLGNNNNNTNNDNNNWETSEREHMFDKVVTPSDVGKLNRLVIPKQHAEKYFPLDSSSTEKGLLLNFEDRNGKSWRFRYSYWNSSQSYVMTKGWSRFVKEKKLDAGDIVSFQRGIGEAARSRLFIDWRRRPNHYHHNLIISNNPSFPIDHHHLHHHRWGYSMPVVPVPTPRNHHESNFLYLGNNGGVVQYPSNYDHHYRHRPQQHHYLAHDNYMSNANVNYGHHVSPILIESLPVASVASATAAPKRLRLFGVNMEYSPNQEDRDQNRRDNDYRHNQISSSSTVQSPPPPHHHHRQVRPIFPIPSTTTSTTSGSNFLAEFSHKGKSSANSLSFDLDP